MKWFLIFCFALALALPAPSQAAQAPALPAPPDCSGYAEKRIYVESQGWWMQTPGRPDGKEFGHLHTGLCFPFGQTVNGVVPFDVRLHMHMNPGVLKKLTIQVWNGGTGASASKILGYRCADDCDYWVHLEVDMGKHPYSGWQEVRIRPSVTEPDGNELVGSTSYQLQAANGKPRKDYRPDGPTQGKGWYSKGTDYAQSQFFDSIPTDAVSGVWRPTAGCHASTLKVSGCIVTVDPDFHHGDFGRVLLRYKGEWRGALAIDTAVLEPGWHRLVVRTDVNDPRGSTLSGLFVVWFEVV